MTTRSLGQRVGRIGAVVGLGIALPFTAGVTPPPPRVCAGGPEHPEDHGRELPARPERVLQHHGPRFGNGTDRCRRDHDDGRAPWWLHCLGHPNRQLRRATGLWHTCGSTKIGGARLAPGRSCRLLTPAGGCALRRLVGYCDSVSVTSSLTRTAVTGRKWRLGNLPRVVPAVGVRPQRRWVPENDTVPGHGPGADTISRQSPGRQILDVIRRHRTTATRPGMPIPTPLRSLHPCIPGQSARHVPPRRALSGQAFRSDSSVLRGQDTHPHDRSEIECEPATADAKGRESANWNATNASAGAPNA